MFLHMYLNSQLARQAETDQVGAARKAQNTYKTWASDFKDFSIFRKDCYAQCL